MVDCLHQQTLKTIPEEGIDPCSYIGMVVQGCRRAEDMYGMHVGQHGRNLDIFCFTLYK